MGLFGSKPKSILGIDIGTSSIKVVELRKSEDKFKLETYGEISSVDYIDKPNDPVVIQEMLRAVLKKADTKSKQAVMAIQIFSSFTSVIEMPEMAEEDLAKSIEFEARKYIPTPLSEVVLDWKIINSGTSDKSKKILLIAVPKEVVNRYIKIADGLNLKINALELESFSFARSLIYKEANPVCVLDIGARATSSTIIDNGIVQMSHGLDIAGAEMTRTLASSLGVAFKRAEGFKLTHGIDQENPEQKDETREALITLIDEIINGSKQIINNFQAKTGKKIEKLILNGGSAQMEGFKDYVEKKLEIKTFIADPWSRIIYPPKLQSILKELGPEFSVAIGAAMREE